MKPYAGLIIIGMIFLYMMFLNLYNYFKATRPRGGKGGSGK